VTVVVVYFKALSWMLILLSSRDMGLSRPFIKMIAVLHGMIGGGGGGMDEA
jgi:hypothetical protein